MNSHDIRKKFQNYFASQGHTWVPSASLIPKEDPSLLFTNAGMNQFKDCFLGIKEPPAPQVCSIQKCLRAGGKHNDLEEVGHSPYHHTFFEMIGSFSFGSYFKKEAIDLAMNFLTKELGLPKDRLWVSVFKEDKESFNLWRKNQQIPKEKIFVLDEKDNFWRMGNTGPCGPCSEIYYYDGDKKNPTPEDMAEIWNLVFMEFNEDHSGKKTPLPQPCIDTGMGMERLAAVLQGKKSNYHTDLFKKIIKSLEKASGRKYDFNQNSLTEDQTAFRVIADHSRAISFLICDGVLPGSDGASYVLRRILRRALFYSHKLKSNKNLLCVAAEQVIHLMKQIYPELSQNKTIIDSTIKQEAELFTESLRQGENILLKKIKNLTNKTIPDSIVWDLYSTYGFPPDLTRLIAKEKGFEVNDLSLEDLKKQNKENTKQSAKRKTTTTVHKEDMERLYRRLTLLEKYLPDFQHIHNIQKTEFTGYKKDKEEGKVFIPNFKEEHLPDTTRVTADAPPPEPMKTNQTGWIITDKTCFYPEGGGPIGDKGIIETKTGKASVLDCQQRGNFIFHAVKVLEGELTTNQSCTLQVNKDHRRLIATSHSATHLLHHALREVLGPSTRQMGSLVKPGLLRFDFSYPKPLNQDQLQEIENKVTKQIESQYPVSDTNYPYEEATRKGALSLAGENYAEEVRTIKMGKSFELCGGIHVKNTSEIGRFKIISETGVQSGVRRITAYTSDLSEKLFTLLEKQNKNLRAHLNLPVPKTPETTNPFIHYLKQKDEEAKQLKHKIKMFLIRAGSKEEEATKEKDNILTKTSTDSFNLAKSEKEKAFLARQNEELRKYLKLSLPKLQDTFEANKSEEELLSFFKKKEEQIKALKKQMENLSHSANSNELIKKATAFQYQDVTGNLLSVALPIEDRKILAEVADNLKSQLSTPAIVVVLGEGKEPYPLVVTVSKELQQHISAGDILKNTIAPFLEGKGGGQARFAQGTIKNKDRFPDLENFLLEKIQGD